MENSLNVIRDIILNQGSLESVLDKMTDAFIFFDNEWKVIHWNKSAERMIQRTAAEVVGHNVWACFPDSNTTQFYQQCHYARQADRSTEFEVYYPVSQCWLEVRAFPQHDGLAVYLKDITKKKLLQLELNRQRTLLSTMMTKGADMVGIISAEGVYRFVSPNAERIFGYSPGELVGQNAFLLVHPDDLPLVREKLGEASSSKEVLIEEFRFKHRDGGWRWVEVQATNMVDDEIIQGILINSREITRRKEGEQELIKAMNAIEAQNTRLKQIAFIQSHQFRRPVANILGLVELAQRVAMSETDRKIVEMLRIAAADLDNQIRRIVELSQPTN